MDVKIKEFDQNKHCRVCLKTYSKMIELFDEDRINSRMLQECCKVEVEEDDELPHVVCEFCLAELTQAYEFITKCRLTDNNIRVFLEKKKTCMIDSMDNLGDSSNFVEGISYKTECKDEELYLSDDMDTSSFQYDDCKVEESSKPSKGRKRKTKPCNKDFPKQCTHCSVILKNNSAWIIHMRCHTDERPYQCNLCGKCFRTKGVLNGHMIVHSNKEKLMMMHKQFICDQCNKVFNRKSNLVNHLRIHSSETPYSCEFCSSTFMQISNLIRHRKQHTEEKRFSCHICQKKFHTSSNLKTHAIAHITERTIPCTECGVMLKSIANLKAHIAVVHKKVRKVVCDKCGGFFSTPGNLKSHIKVVHSNSSGYCHICNKDFPDIKEHGVEHSGEMPYQCNTCGKKFATKTRLKRHIRKHINSDKYSCEYEHCNKKFSLKFMLDFHVIKFHMKITPFNCRYCKRGFHRVCDLTRHLKLHHSDQTLIGEEIKKVQSEEKIILKKVLSYSCQDL